MISSARDMVGVEGRDEAGQTAEDSRGERGRGRKTSAGSGNIKQKIQSTERRVGGLLPRRPAAEALADGVDIHGRRFDESTMRQAGLLGSIRVSVQASIQIQDQYPGIPDSRNPSIARAVYTQRRPVFPNRKNWPPSRQAANPPAGISWRPARP